MEKYVVIFGFVEKEQAVKNNKSLGAYARDASPHPSRAPIP